MGAELDPGLGSGLDDRRPAGAGAAAPGRGRRGRDDVVNQDLTDDDEDDDELDDDELDDDELDDKDGDGRRGSRRTVVVIRTVLVGLLFLIAAGALGYAFAGGSATPADNSVAAGLARDMTDHHAQAVDMATIIQARTKDPAIHTLATDIALTQTNQMGQMQGWLNTWKLSLGRSGPPMTWMHTTDGMNMGTAATAGMNPALMHLQPNGLMPGMATQAQVNELRTLPPAQADILFLQLMIKHHQGGVAMAQTALDETKVPVVVALCKTIVTDQQNEIVQMTQLLQQRHAHP